MYILTCEIDIQTQPTRNFYLINLSFNMFLNAVLFSSNSTVSIWQITLKTAQCSWPTTLRYFKPLLPYVIERLTVSLLVQSQQNPAFLLRVQSNFNVITKVKIQEKSQQRDLFKKTMNLSVKTFFFL